ncbi:hypothetical protein As57867_007697, partial [Aphanomyces stellatus]
MATRPDHLPFCPPRRSSIMSPHSADDFALPRFATITPSTIAAALRTTIDETTFDLNSFEDDLGDPAAAFTWESVMDRLEIINDPLNRLWAVAMHYSKAKNSPDLRLVIAEMQDQVLAIQSRQAQSPILFYAMAKLRDSDDATTLSREQQRILDRAIQHSILHGVALVDADRNRFNDIRARLSQLYATFSNHLLDAVGAYALVVHDKTNLDGLPDSALSLYAKNAITAGFQGATTE